MLVALLIVAVYILILKRIEKPTVQIIQNNTDISIVLEQRKKLKTLRKNSLIIVFFICFLLYVLQKFVFDCSWTDIDLIKGLFYSCFFSILTLKRRTDHNPLGTMYSLSKDDVITSGGEYVLYLRSFEKDNYKQEYSIWQKKFKSFSEYHFTSILGRFTEVYAVGMTKELEAPKGAKRVYLSDADWKTDVSDLMKNATLIVVLVDNRESCLWEIEQSLDMLNKTIFLVDDRNRYLDVLCAVGGKVSFPRLTEDQKTPLAFYMKDNHEYDIYQFAHTKKSYKELVRRIVEDHLHKKFKRKFKDTVIGKIIIYWLLFTLATTMASLLTGVLANGDNNVYVFFACWILLLIAGFIFVRKTVYGK